jgi:hypothetical protein
MPVLGYSSDDATAPPTALVEQPAGPLGYSSNDAIDRGIGSKLPHDPVAGAGERLFEPSVASQASGYVSAGGGTTYGDWLQTGKAGLHGAGAALATLAGKAADTPEQTAYWQKQAAGQRAEQQQDVQGMTPAGQQGRAGSFWAHPVQQAIEAAPGLAIQGIPAIIGGAMAGPPGAIAGAALAGGAYQGSSEVSDYTQQIMDAPEETLMKNPDYAALVASGMKPEDARLKFADASSKGLFAKSATIGALTSVPFAEVGGGGAAKILGDKLVTRVLAGGLEGGAAMTAQGAAQTQVSGQAGYEAGVRGPPTPEETRQGALAGLETGLQLGPAAALLHGRPGRRLDAKPGETGSQQGRTPADIRGAEAKPRATAGAPPEAPAPPAAPAAARQPGSPIADPTIRAATGEGVTPEGNQPEVATAQPERVQAPPQPQPEAQPISRPTEAPPAADTTGQVSPPVPPPEARPAPAPTPAAPVPDAALAAQHAALVDRSNPREAMVYEKGTPLLPLPDATFGQTRLKDGRIVQYDKQGPNALTPAKVGRLNSAGRLDEVIQDRPVIKAPAEERPAAAPEPAPEKAEAGAAATAPDYVTANRAAAVEAAAKLGLTDRIGQLAREGNTAKEIVAKLGDDRLDVNDVRAVRDHLGIEPVGPLGVFGAVVPREEVTLGVTGRVLRPETEAEQAVAAQQLAAQEAVKGVALKEEAAPAGRHWSKGELAKKENANQAANEIMARHPPGEREQPNDIYKRAKAMVEEAQGIHVPTEVSEAGKHGPGILLLREAKDLLAKDPNSKPALARFLDREGMIRRGELREALEARRAEGKESVALGSPEGGGAEGVRPGEHAEELSPEEEIIRKEEEAERAKEEPEEVSGRWDVPEDASRGDILRKMEAAKAIARDQNIGKEERDNAMRGVERLQKALQREPEGKERPKIEVKEGEHYTAGKAPAKFKVEKARTREGAAARREARASERAKEEMAAQPTGKERTAEQRLDEERGAKLTDIMKRTEERAAQAEKVEQAERLERERFEREREEYRQSDEYKQIVKEREATERARRVKDRLEMLDKYSLDPSELRKIRDDPNELSEIKDWAREKLAPHEARQRKIAEAENKQTLERQIIDAEEFIKSNRAAYEKMKGGPEILAGLEAELERNKARYDETYGGKEEQRLRFQRMLAEEARPAKVMTSDEDGNPVEITPRRTMTAREAIAQLYDPKIYSRDAREMNKRLIDKLNKLAGDTLVHFISHDDMVRVGGPSYGLYDPMDDHILLNDDYTKPDTMLHELFHAATTRALDADPHLGALMARLRNDVRANMPEYLDAQSRGKLEYALSDPEEFLTGMMTNPDVQRLLKSVKISDELAREINMPRWRKMTMWNGVLDIIRQALGMEPRDVSAIEAAMAITEHTIWKQDAGEMMEAAGRLANRQMEEGTGARRFQRMNPPERDQERFVRTPSEAFKNARGITRDVAAQFTKDRMVNLSDKLMHGSAKALSGTWLNEMHGHLFEDAKGKILDAINQARNKVSSTYSKLMESDRDIINRGYMLDRIYASHMPDYAQLINLSSAFNIHADRAAPKIPKNPVDAARKNWQGNAKYDEARAIYDKLPEELRKRYSDEKRFYMDKQAQSAQAIIDKVMPLFDPPKGSTLDEVMARARKNDLTDDDWEHYENLKVAPALRKAANLLSKKDFYANSQRDGRYVVTGRYEMPAGGSDTSHSGELLPDNKREFDTEKEAHDYVVGTHMHAITREVHYWTDKATGDTKRVPADFATSDPGKETIKYQVRLERDNTQMATSKAEALRNRQAMEADGVKELSGVLDKRDEKAWSKINTADQKAIERKIDGSPNLTDAERQSLKDMSRQLMLAGQGGMGAHMIQARKVAGAKYDTGAGLHAYARAANYHMAREEHAAEIDDGMTRLDEHERANRMDTDASRRSIVANEYRDRVYGRNADALDAKTHPLLHRMMTWAFVNFLMRPSHILLSQVHPYVYSVPMLASRHGYWKALQGQRQAMNDLGGTLHNLKEGMQAGWDVYRSGRERDIDRAVQMAHGVDPIRVQIGRLKSAEEREFLNKMWDTQHLHSAYDASVFEGSGMDRANAAMKQFTDAMEANNRLSTALNAYRLEKAMHGDKAQALSYSRRVIEETHGLFSPTNAASAFKNPIVRAALQFRQQPMNLAIMMYRNIAKAATGDAEARWTLAYQLGTAAALGGMGGMPMDLPKLAGLAGQALGGPSPDDWADRTHRFLVSVAGETVANGIENGIPGMMGPFGPSLGHRTGFDAGFLFGSPNSERPDDMLSYAAKMAIGATGGMAVDWLNAVHQMEQGNYERASEGVLPGSLKDFAKAYRLATEGTMAGKQQVRPASYGEALLQALGFSSVEREQALAGHMALQKAIKAQPLTRGEQLKQAHRAKQTVLGVPVTARDRALAQEYQRAYQ